MKYQTLPTLALFLLLISCSPQSPAHKFAEQQQIILQDISNFYDAFDKIQTTSDSLNQIEYLQTSDQKTACV